MSQGNAWSPTTGTVSGLNITNNYNAALSALISMNSGASAPANDISAVAVLGQQWLDTSASPLNKTKLYDSTSWLITGVIDQTNHVWTPVVGGGTATLASAATTDLGSVMPAFLTISGTTTITSFGSTAAIGQLKFLKFSGALTLTHNATSLILPGSVNITTVAGDKCAVVQISAGNWEMLSYTRADGTIGNGSVSAVTLTASAVGLNAPINCSIAASVATNNLTVTVNGANGAALSGSNPLISTFRSATIGSGVPVTRTVISSPTFTVNATNTMGGVNGQPMRLRVVLIDNAGTVLVGLINCLGNPTGNIQIFPLSETTLNSTGAGTGGGNNAGVIQTSVASLSGLAIREIGFLEWSTALTTAGTYANVPNEIQLAGPGYKRAGDSVQTNTAVINSTSTTSLATFSAFANQNISITLTSAANVVRVDATGIADDSTGSVIRTQLSRGTTAATNMIGNISGDSNNGTVAMYAYDFPATLSAVTYAVQGKTTAGILTYTTSGNPAVMSVQEISA